VRHSLRIQVVTVYSLSRPSGCNASEIRFPVPGGFRVRVKFRVTRRPQGLPKCESLAQPLSGSSEVRVTGSAPEAGVRPAGATRRGPRDSRLEQPVVVHPGNIPKYGRGWRRGTQFVAARYQDRTRDIDAWQPARDRRYVAVIL
jgi:hypothetical protein